MPFFGRVKRNIANWEESHMATWLCYAGGACCIIWALMQTRTTLVYMGVLKSAVIGEYASPPLALIHVAIEDAISYSIIGILLFVSPWPKVITYVLFVLLLKALAKLFLAILGVGYFGAVELIKKGKIHRVLGRTISVLVYLIAVWASAYFLA